jgi:hypothetical protein
MCRLLMGFGLVPILSFKNCSSAFYDDLAPCTTILAPKHYFTVFAEPIVLQIYALSHSWLLQTNLV